MKLKMISASLLGCFFIPSAFAMPVADGSVAQSLDVRGIAQAALVCDAWGRCYQTYPSYGGYAGYGGYGSYGSYSGGYYRRGGDWDDDEGYRGGGRRDWDGRDWHGGRWGEW